MASPFQSGPIQVIPAGLLGLLQLKSPMGVNPQVLEGNVQPTIDMLPSYLNARSQVSLVNSAISLSTGQVGARVFSPNAIIVPANEWWWVDQYTIYTNDFSGTDAVKMAAPIMIMPRVGTRRYHLLNDPISVDTASIATTAMIFGARGFYAPPGAELAIWIGQVTATTSIPFTADLRYTPLTV